MTSLPVSDVSLYELATNSEKPPQPLQMSPTTFKTLVANVFDLLVDQEISATIWLKLPKGEVWQTEVERFCQTTSASYEIRQLHTQQDKPTKKPPAKPRTTRRSLVPVAATTVIARAATEADEVLATLPEDGLESTAGYAIQNFLLAPDSQLKREYFLLVVAAEFQTLILAHRPRSMKAFTEILGKPEEKIPEAVVKLSQIVEESIEQKHPLLGFCSFETVTLKEVLAGINQAVYCSQPLASDLTKMPTPVESAAPLNPLVNSAVAATIVSWRELTERYGHLQLNPVLIGRLFAKQVYRQEEIWRGGAVYRRQADSLQDVKQENEELSHSLQRKNEFVRNLGQELRTPLTNMKTALSLLNSPTLKQQQRQRYMEMISQECDRQSSIITGVLDLIQLESNDEQVPMESLRLMDIVPAVVSTYQPLAQEKGIMLAYIIPEDLPPVACLNHWLKQIVINLLYNSLKFTPTGGQVWVRAKQSKDFVQIEFRDTGVGISQSDLLRIFDCFYRIRQPGDETKGVGLGLAIVQQLLVRCGGAIAVKSKFGEGSIFSVTLPIYQKN